MFAPTNKKKSSNTFLTNIKNGIAFGLGLSIFALILVFLSSILLSYYGYSPIDQFNRIQNLVSSEIYDSNQQVNFSGKAPNSTDELNPYLNKQFSLPDSLTSVNISSTEQLETELKKATKLKGNFKFIFDNGLYQIGRTLRITVDNIAFTSKSGDPKDVIIQGSGMRKTAKVSNLIYVRGKHFTLSGITLQNSGAHLIQIAGEHNADFPVMRDCILQDSYQQMVKVSYDIKNRPEQSADFGLIENCTFKYTAGIGPQYYIGGIDAHGANGWIIRNNTFKNIASPSGSAAEFAIHFWNNTNNNLVTNNIIEDCDRGIGFGFQASRIDMGYSNNGGKIIGNTIIHKENDHPFADTGIAISNSPNTIVSENAIWLGHNYPRAIEYRFPYTTGVIINNNTTNKAISSRDGGKALLKSNDIKASLIDILEKHINTNQ